MMTVESPVPGPAFPTAAMFEAPGRPRPLARRLAIHNRVVRRLREFFETDGFHEVPVTALADHPARVQLDGMLSLGFGAVWCESEIMPPGGRLEPRHLRGFRAAADREVGLVEQVVGARRGDDARRHAAEVAHLCLRLHAGLVRGGLSAGQG